MPNVRWLLPLLLTCLVVMLVVCWAHPAPQRISRPIPEAVEWVEPAEVVPEQRPVVKSTKRLSDDSFEDDDAFFEEPKPRHCEPNFARRFFMVGPCYK